MAVAQRINIPSRAEVDPFDQNELADAFPGILFSRSTDPGWPVKCLTGCCVALTGYDSGALVYELAQGYDSIRHPEDLDRIAETIRGAAEEKGPYTVEYRIRTKSGEEKWVSERGVSVLDDGGALEGYNGSIFDITQFKAREEALKRKLRKYESTVEHASEGIFQSTPQGAFIDANPALARLFGYASREELMASVDDIPRKLYVNPERRREFIRLLEQEETVTGFEAEARTKDGSVVWVSANARAVRDETGALLYYEGSAADITERKRAGEALASERNMLRTLIDSLPDSIFVKDACSRYILSNAAHTRSLGFTSPGEIEGKTAFDFFSKERAERFIADDHHVLTTGEPILNREEVRLGSEQKQTWVLTTKLPLHGPKGDITGLVCISSDISERKDLEEKLRQSQKMAAVGRLAGVVAHDFNNILTSIIGFGELLLGNAAIDDLARKDVEEIYSAAIRASALTQQLLVFGQPQTVQPVTTNLNDLDAATKAERSQEEPPAVGTETILLVEDDPSVRKLTASLLGKLGYTILQADGGAEAMNVIRECDTLKIDLLLTDVMMPQVGGKRLADNLEVLSPGTRVLFTSGYNEEEMMLQGISAREIAFLPKPFSPSLLARKIREVLDR